MDPVNPVLPGEGRWLTGDTSARASEEAGVQSDLTRTLRTTFQLSQKFFQLEDCMLSLWSLCSRSLMYSSSVEESVRLKEDHMKDINSTVVRLPIFVLWDSHSVQGMAFKKYIYEIKRARGESMTSWINRSDEALVDMRKKLATAPGANSSESTMIPPQIQGSLLLHKARLRDQDIVGVMTMTGGSLNIKLVEKSPPDLFTDDVLQSVDRSHGKDSGNPRKQHAFEAIEEVPVDDDDTYLDENLSENDDPYIDEDGNFLANEQIVSDIDDDLALDDEEYHEALLGYREARDLMKEARVAHGFYLVVVPIRSDKPTGRG